MAETLKCRSGLGLPIACGVRVMLGAGIYVLAAAMVAGSGFGAGVAGVMAGAILCIVESLDLGTIFTVAGLAGFAFIGFELVANVTEQVAEPECILRPAILLLSGVARALYTLASVRPLAFVWLLGLDGRATVRSLTPVVAARSGSQHAPSRVGPSLRAHLIVGAAVIGGALLLPVMDPENLPSTLFLCVLMMVNAALLVSLTGVST